MKKHNLKTAAAAMSALLALQCVPMMTANVSAADGDILVTGFEDGDVSAFSKRGDDDTSVIAACTDDPHSGDKCMSVLERSQGWNGPSISLEALGCEPGVQYIASAWVKMKWYNNGALSMQYTDDEGKQHYDNLMKFTSDNKWVQIPETTFCFDESMKDVSIYIEGADKADMWVDDFVLKKAPVYEIEQDIPGLKDVFGQYFKVGGAVTAGELAPQSAKNLILKHYNSLTLGNELKPENLFDAAASKAYYEETGDNTKPVVKLNGKARSILNFCRKNNISVRGHVLVWYSQTPITFFTEDYSQDGKMVDKNTMLKRMEAYIKGVFECLNEEYSDIDFYAWDVVNEAYEDSGQPRNPGKYEESNGSSAWVKIFGDNSFIPPAFEYARKYAPKNTKLYYNDYNEWTQKQDAILEMALDLHEKGWLDGIGMQSHFDVRTGPDAWPSTNVYESCLKKYCESGLDVQITEMDATLNKEYLNEKGYKIQAEYYGKIFDAIMKYKDHISAVVFWGTTDDKSWRAEGAPLLFDKEFKSKPAFKEIIDGIEYTVTEPKVTTTTTTTVTTPTTPVATKKGDVDESGTVDVSDAVLLARFLAEDADATITDAGKANADCNDDGQRSSDDVTMILKAIALLIKL